MQRIEISEVGDLLQQPWLATLATYRKSGQVLLSPVWFEWTGEAFLVSLVHGDAKELHLRRNPQASLVIAEEASYPGRVLEASGVATVQPDANAQAITRIAIRYLGEDVARRWVALYPEINWDLMRLVPERMRALDHRNLPMLREAKPTYPTTTGWRIEMVPQQPGVRA